MFYTYIWRDAAGVPFYVGKGTGRRAHDTTNRSAEFIATHSQGGCTVEVADEFILESQAHEHEVALISKYGRREFGGTLVNKTDGGEGASGTKRSEQTRSLMRGPKSAEHRANISVAKIGETRSPETRAKISAKLRGKPLTDATKDKISAALLGRRFTPEHRAKIAAANTGKTHSTQSLEKMSRASTLRGRLSPPRSDNQSGYKGVSFNAARERWVAQIHTLGVNPYIGMYASPEAAARAYDAAAVAAWGAGNCFLNFPDEHLRAEAA